MLDVTLADLNEIVDWVAIPLENQTDFENWVGNFLYEREREDNRQWEMAVLIWRLKKDPALVVEIVKWAKNNAELIWVLVNGLEINGAVEVENKFLFVKPNGMAKNIGKPAVVMDNNIVLAGDLAVFDSGKKFKFQQGLKINNKNSWDFVGNAKIIVDVRGEIRKGEFIRWQKQLGL